MRQRKKFTEALREDLVRYGLYNVRNNRLIQTAATNEWIIETAFDALKGKSALLEQTGSQGQTKIAPNPLIETIRKATNQNAYIYAVLGMGNRDAEVPTGDTELDQFIKSLQQ